MFQSHLQMQTYRWRAGNRETSRSHARDPVEGVFDRDPLVNDSFELGEDLG